MDQPLNAAVLTDEMASDGHIAMSPTKSTDSDEVAKLRAELDQMVEVQRELMRLLGTKQPNRILHDVRNLLQERIFLMAACKDSHED